MRCGEKSGHGKNMAIYLGFAVARGNDSSVGLRSLTRLLAHRQHRGLDYELKCIERIESLG